MVGRRIVGRRRRRRGRGRIKRAVIPEFIVSPAKFKIDRTEILFFLYPVVSFIFVQLVTGVVVNKWLLLSSFLFTKVLERGC